MDLMWSLLLLFQDGSLVRQYKGASGIFEVCWSKDGDKLSACYSNNTVGWQGCCVPLRPPPPSPSAGVCPGPEVTASLRCGQYMTLHMSTSSAHLTHTHTLLCTMYHCTSHPFE